MKVLILMLCLLPMSAFSAWQMEVGLGIDGETWKIEQSKFEEAKENIINMGNYVLKMTLKKGTEPKSIDVVYTLHEKKGDNLTLVNKGEETIEEKLSSDIYAKGEKNQPNSIITLKLKK